VSPEASAALTEALRKLAEAGFRVTALPGIESHFALERDGFAAIVERDPDGFGRFGSSGLVTGEGLAVLYWKGGKAHFVTKSAEVAATPEQLALHRQFSADIRDALGASRSHLAR